MSEPPEPRYTSHQVARTARPDAARGSKLWLIKHVPHLRLTYQIRLLTQTADESGRKLIITLPKGATTSAELRRFVREHGSAVRIERAEPAG